MDDQVKLPAGVTTSSFWVTLLTPIFSALAGLGILTISKVSLYSELASAIIVGVISMATVLGSLYLYIRKSLKETEMKANASIIISKQPSLG